MPINGCEWSWLTPLRLCQGERRALTSVESELIISVIYPWEAIVDLCKKYGVLSMVDAAHSIGQHKVNVAKVNCDFFVSVRMLQVWEIFKADHVELPQVAYEV
jgi:hypothetical protein